MCACACARVRVTPGQIIFLFKAVIWDSTEYQDINDKTMFWLRSVLTLLTRIR